MMAKRTYGVQPELRKAKSANFQGRQGAELHEGNRAFNCNRAGPYMDSGSSSFIGSHLFGAPDALIGNNIVDLDETSQPIIRHSVCDKVHYFNNTKSDGTLLRGTERTHQNNVDIAQPELAATIEDALTLSLL